MRTARPHRCATAEPSLAGTDDQQAAHVDAVGIQRAERGDSQSLSVAAHVPAYNDRRVRRTELKQELARSNDLLPPGTRGRVVDGEHQIRFSNSAQPPLNHRPWLEPVR